MELQILMARREQLASEYTKGKARYKELSDEISNLESNMLRIEGAIVLCDEFIKQADPLDTQTVIEESDIIAEPETNNE